MMKRLMQTTIRLLVGIPLAAAAVHGLFALAGGYDWTEGWVYLGSFFLAQAATGLVVWMRDPELIRRRSRPGEGTKRWDMVMLTLFFVAYIAELIAAAYDAGHQVAQLPRWTMFAGIASLVVGQVLIGWAMLTNTHFEKTARIQTDRSHRVIDTGPYRLVRHPGYLATIMGFVLPAVLITRSGLAGIPAAAALVVLIVRTALEDRMLRTELDGYARYASRVKYRLMRYVW